MIEVPAVSPHPFINDIGLVYGQMGDSCVLAVRHAVSFPEPGLSHLNTSHIPSSTTGTCQFTCLNFPNFHEWRDR